MWANIGIIWYCRHSVFFCCHPTTFLSIPLPPFASSYSTLSPPCYDMPRVQISYQLECMKTQRKGLPFGLFETVYLEKKLMWPFGSFGMSRKKHIVKSLLQKSDVNLQYFMNFDPKKIFFFRIWHFWPGNPAQRLLTLSPPLFDTLIQGCHFKFMWN